MFTFPISFLGGHFYDADADDVRQAIAPCPGREAKLVLVQEQRILRQHHRALRRGAVVGAVLSVCNLDGGDKYVGTDRGAVYLYSKRNFPDPGYGRDPGYFRRPANRYRFPRWLNTNRH